MTASFPRNTAYNGLATVEPTLPSDAYLTATAYQRDLETIWYRSWVDVCRSSDIAQPLDYRTTRIGSQEIVVLRDEHGDLQAFHNTCRHRGSALCQSEQGRLKGRLLVCPYHSWSYSLRGDLIRAPSKVLPDGFDRADYPLYKVQVAEWRGLVFVNLDMEAGPLAESFDTGSADLANWPIEGLVTGHRLVKTMRCNWKVFWENFNECLHCPGVHKHLSALVPIYGRGLMARHDDPDWEAHANDDAPEFSGALRNGAETWSGDGKALEARFEALSEAERAAGQSYATNLPSMFVVGHVDYVRTVSLRPIGPEETQLTAEWLFRPEAIEREADGIRNIVEFGTEVLNEDAEICEINQRGLTALPHKAGVLMPEEYELKRFHDWLRDRWAQSDLGR